MTTTPLTPEAVASLTDAELSEAVARVVFQAENLADYEYSEDPDYPFFETDVDGKFLLYADVWEDWDTNIYNRLEFGPQEPRAVHLVLEHMRQRWAERYDTGDDGNVPYWSITGESDRWLVDAMVDGEDFLERVLVGSTGPSLGRCVFAAALIAAQEMEKEG